MKDDKHTEETTGAEEESALPLAPQAMAPIPAAVLAQSERLLKARGGQLRQALLEKLAPLVYRGANVADIAQVAVDSELKSLVELEADVLLEPLRSIAPRHE